MPRRARATNTKLEKHYRQCTLKKQLITTQGTTQKQPGSTQKQNMNHLTSLQRHHHCTKHHTMNTKTLHLFYI
jgi:hypothetical protein